MEAGETGEAGGQLVDLGIVLHGAGAQRIEAALDVVVLRGKVDEVPHGFGFADLWQADGAFSPQGFGD